MGPVRQNPIQRTSHLSVLMTVHSFSESARDLGVVIDSQLSLSAHVTALCRSGYYYLRQFRPAARSLSTDAQAFISCRLDYCNSLMSGMADSLLQKYSQSRTLLPGSCLGPADATTSHRSYASCTGFRCASESTSNSARFDVQVAVWASSSVPGGWCSACRWQRTTSAAICQWQNLCRSTDSSVSATEASLLLDPEYGMLYRQNSRHNISFGLSRRKLKSHLFV